MSNVGQSTVPFSLYVIYVCGLVRLYNYFRKKAEVDPIKWHNMLTVSAVVLIHVFTGIRFVDSPLVYLTHRVNSTLELIFPQDKDVDDFKKVRIAYMPPICRDILLAYAMHLSRLARKLKVKKRNELAGQFYALIVEDLKVEEQPIAYFSFIDDYFSAKPLTGEYIKKTLGRRWPFRLEEARCQYCNFMKHEDAPDFVKEDQLGHQKELHPTYASEHQWCIFDFKTYMEKIGKKFVLALGVEHV